jgi:hypothetical protein
MEQWLSLSPVPFLCFFLFLGTVVAGILAAFASKILLEEISNL